jgi:WD40 repeat protein
MRNSPFKFLDSYTLADRDIFFGRDREIEELYHRVFESKLMLVYGVSGTGKSSLIHCGLANKFQDTDWLPVNVRRGGNILDSMAFTLQKTALTPLDSDLKTPSQFKKAVKSLYFDYYKPIYFIFDQFEELSIFGSQEEKNGLVQVIKSLAASDLQCRFIFVLREEYLATVSLFEKAIPGFFSNRIRIEKMNRENAIKAIEGPCNVSDIKTDEGFSQAVLDKLCPGESEIELTYLQVYLDRIFRLAAELKEDSRGIHFTNELIEKAGNVTDVLGDFLDEQVAKQNEPELALALLKAFVSVKGTRKPMTQTEVSDFILSIGRQVPEEILTGMLQVFVNLRILHEKNLHGKYELRHDALAAKIFDKFTLGEKELLEVRKFIENAYFNHEMRRIFLNKEDLDYLGNYTGKLILPKELDEFVKNSRNRLHAQKRALTILTRISALLFIVIAGGIARYYMNTQENSKNKDLINVAALQSQLNPVQSLNTAFSVWESDTSSALLLYIILNDVRRILDDSLEISAPAEFREKYKPFTCGSEITCAKISRTGKYIYGCLSDNSIFTWETITRKLHKFKTDLPVLNIKLNERDSSLAVIFEDGSSIIADFGGKEKFTFKVTPNRIMNERLISFFPYGNYYLAGINGDKAMIFDSTGACLFELMGHSGRINSLDISADGKFLATASSDKLILVWNFNYQTKCFSPYDTLTGHSDTVWSCEFDKSGLYILTASADTTTRIWDLDGNNIDPELYFATRYEDVSRMKITDLSQDDDKYNPDLKYYYSRASNASFGGNDRVIIMTGYETGMDGKTEYSQVFFFDRNASQYLDWLRDPMLQILSGNADTIITAELIHSVISPDCRLAAVEKKNSGHVSLVSPQGLQMIRFPGTFPMFSLDKSKFYWINKESINSFPVNPKEIRRVFDESGLLKVKKHSSAAWTVI